MARHRYTAEQEAWLRREGPHFPATGLAKRFNRTFFANVTRGAIMRKCRTLGVPLRNSGPEFNGRFQPGRKTPPCSRNHGPNSGSFGHGRPGGSPIAPIGTERTEKNGDILIKVAEPDPYRPGKPDRWVRKARWLFELTHGPVPAGMVVIQEDGDQLNFAPSNLVLVNRRVLAVVNSRLRKRGAKPAPGERRILYTAARIEEAIAARQAEGTC